MVEQNNKKQREIKKKKTTGEIQLPIEQLSIDDLIVPVYYETTLGKCSSYNRKTKITLYKPGIIFLQKDVSFTYWAISEEAVDQAKKIIEEYAYMNVTDHKPYPRKMAAVRGYFMRSDSQLPSKKGIIINVCGGGCNRSDFSSDTYDAHHLKEGVENKHLQIWERVLSNLRKKQLIISPYQCGFKGLEIMTLYAEYIENRSGRFYGIF